MSYNNNTYFSEDDKQTVSEISLVLTTKTELEICQFICPVHGVGVFLRQNCFSLNMQVQRRKCWNALTKRSFLWPTYRLFHTNLKFSLLILRLMLLAANNDIFVWEYFVRTVRNFHSLREKFNKSNSVRARMQSPEMFVIKWHLLPAWTLRSVTVLLCCSFSNDWSLLFHKLLSSYKYVSSYRIVF